MDNPRITLTQAEFDRWQLHYPSNLVCVEMPPKGDLKTKAGIVVNFNENVLYAEGEGSHIADVAQVYGTVAKMVDRLYYNPKDMNGTMSWHTENELKIGDKIWFHHLISKNCTELEVGSKLYKMIPYEDLFVAKRGEEVICLNGNILLDELLDERLSPLDVLPKEMDKTRGIVTFNGSDNKAYLSRECDMPGLEKGDLVLIRKGAYVFHLERSIYNSNFDGGKPYICIQKRYIDAVI